MWEFGLLPSQPVSILFAVCRPSKRRECAWMLHVVPVSCLSTTAAFGTMHFVPIHAHPLYQPQFHRHLMTEGYYTMKKLGLLPKSASKPVLKSTLSKGNGCRKQWAFWRQNILTVVQMHDLNRDGRQRRWLMNNTEMYFSKDEKMNSWGPAGWQSMGVLGDKRVCVRACRRFI